MGYLARATIAFFSKKEVAKAKEYEIQTLPTLFATPDNQSLVILPIHPALG